MEQNTEQSKEIKKPKSSFLKYITFIISGFAILSLIIAKVINPEFNTGIILIPFIIFAIVVIAIYFGPLIAGFISGKGTKTDSLPEPITNEEAFKMILNAMEEPRYADKIDSIISEGSESIGQGIKSEIYHILFLGKMRHPQRNCYLYVINKHFPENKKLVRIFKENERPNTKMLHSIKNSVAHSPESQPDIQEIEEKNLLTGTERKIKTTKHSKKNKDEKAKAETLE